MSKEHQGDARALTLNWETIVDTVDYPTVRFAIITGNLIADSYMRARGIRMNSRRSLTRPKVLAVSVMVYAMFECVYERPHMYPNLHRMGFTDREASEKLLVGKLIERKEGG